MKRIVFRVFLYIYELFNVDFKALLSIRSHHTSGIESPSELSDSPCQTVPSSPQKAKGSNATCAGSNLSDDQQMKLTAEQPRDSVCEAAERELIADSADGLSNQNAETDQVEVEEQPLDGISENKDPSSPMKQTALPSNVQVKISNGYTGKNEIDVLAAKLADDSYSSSPKSVEKSEKIQSLGGENSKLQYEEQSFSEPTESANFVTCASEFGSSSSIDGEPMEDISPIERVMLEKCIRAGLPQRNLDQNQGARQKIPQLSYQLLRDTAEKHPKACSFESDRSTSLKSLDLKENEYESHSENEEKGKEDERKAEKKRLFRIPESPVDKRAYNADSNKIDYSPSEEKDGKRNENTSVYNMKVVVDQKGNRRCEKYEKHSDKVKSKQSSSEPVPSQLDFLMTSKKASPAVANVDRIEHPSEIEGKSSHLQSTSIQKSSQDLDHSKTDCFVESDITREKEEKTLTTSETDSSTYFTLKDDDISNETGIKTQNFEKDIDCCERENSGDSEDSMLSSSLLCEAREIAEALLGARIDSTEDMTVSTLSCLSDIDNARPPSVMGEMGSLSMTNSAISEENLKAAVTKECQKLLGKAYNKQTPSSKKSLLRELQIVRLNSEHGQNDYSKGSNESPENLSMKSSSASDLLGNVNPPSILDDISLTTSTGSLNGIEGCDSECDSEKVIAPYPSKQDSSMSERMNDAAAMAQLYAKELSNITGNCIKQSVSNEALSRMKTQSGVQEVMEVTIADVTEIGCDTIGSDTELEDDLPCDDEDPGSDTLQAPFHNTLSKEDQGDGSTENLTLTLTEEPLRADMSPYFDFSKNNGCFMTADEFKALQENADMILNTLREAEISDDEDDEDHCGMSNGDMLEDETMSLVSNESDEEFLSPDGTMHSHLQRHSPKSDTSQVCNGMVALPQSSLHTPSKYARKTASQMQPRNKSISSGLPKPEDSSMRHRNSYPEAGSNLKYGQMSSNVFQSSEIPNKSVVPLKTNQINEHSLSRIKPPVSAKKPLDSNEVFSDEHFQNQEEHSGFDSRTFTRKKSTVPKGMIPSIHSGPQAGTLRSPSSHSIPSLPGSMDNIASKTSEPPKVVTSKIAAVWKTGKVRSKSMVDANRNSKFRLEKSSSTGSTKDEKFGANHSERSPSETPSPQSPLSRSSTYEKLNEDDGNASSLLRRPSTLPLSQKTGSPRHMKMPSTAPRALARQGGDGLVRPRVTVPKTDIVSPTSHQNSSNIPKFQNKAQPSLIPNRRSMIPTPAKFELPEN